MAHQEATMTTLPQPEREPGPLGPFATAQQAQAAVRHITALEPGTGAWSAAARQMLLDACGSAGVALGAYDEAVLAWAGSFEPWAAAVFAGLITRAHAAGKAGQP
jgi:hypothetical protein